MAQHRGMVPTPEDQGWTLEGVRAEVGGRLGPDLPEGSGRGWEAGCTRCPCPVQPLSSSARLSPGTEAGMPWRSPCCPALVKTGSRTHLHPSAGQVGSWAQVGLRGADLPEHLWVKGSGSSGDRQLGKSRGDAPRKGSPLVLPESPMCGLNKQLREETSCPDGRRALQGLRCSVLAGGAGSSLGASSPGKKPTA